MSDIAGYDYGTSGAAHSPVTSDELRALEASVGWTAADATLLQAAGRVLCPQAEAMVDSWRTEIAKQPHLVQSFVGPDGTPDDRYRAAVKRRFVQWVIDTCTRPRDQAWLDYQEEIGLRHTPAKKNQTDGTHTPNVVPMRLCRCAIWSRSSGRWCWGCDASSTATGVPPRRSMECARPGRRPCCCTSCYGADRMCGRDFGRGA